ncbi:MAG: hypothetical protein RL323_1281, partial [Pseudomonadota bacterium]
MFCSTLAQLVPPAAGLRLAHGIGLALVFSAPAWSATIYTCVDGQGRRLTSDRPIPECIDREQRELLPTGALKRVVPPAMTAEERAKQEVKQRAEAEQLARVNEERRRERALVARYPNQATHDRARDDALTQIDDVMGAIAKRQIELEKQRTEIAAEMEFYRRDPSKAPAWLKKRLEENAQQTASQAQHLADQTAEKNRINTRFDEELV